MKRIIFSLLMLCILNSASAMDFESSIDPCIDLSIGIINEHPAFGIATEVPFWKPCTLRLRYNYLAGNKDDIEADMFSLDIVYAQRDNQTSGYRFYPYIAAGAHYLIPDHKNYDMDPSLGVHAYAGCFYKIMPFHLLYLEGGIYSLKYEPDNQQSYTESKLFLSIGYKFIF